MYQVPQLPLTCDVQTVAVLRQCVRASRKLGELKSIVQTVPNASILIDTLSLQEAKESSEIESIITTHDELYRAQVIAQQFISPAAKEVQNYAYALREGFEKVVDKGVLTSRMIIEIYQRIKNNDAGFRSTPGTMLKNDRTQQVVYTPPQSYDQIVAQMVNLEQFINEERLSDLDPLIKMAIIHHQFESIHPFTDGNGRTGRIINILYLVLNKLIELPVLYLSRYITRTKAEYYRLLQDVRDNGSWENWIIYILRGVEQTAIESIALIKAIKEMMATYKHRIREKLPKIYSQDLINNLFRHPYTKIAFLQRDLNVSRPTAVRYLDELTQMGILTKIKLSRENYYLNEGLYTLIANAFHSNNEPQNTIDPIDVINSVEISNSFNV